MRAELKHWLADWIPPHLRRVLHSISPNDAVSYSGSYASWADARQHSAMRRAPIYNGPAAFVTRPFLRYDAHYPAT